MGRTKTKQRQRTIRVGKGPALLGLLVLVPVAIVGALAFAVSKLFSAGRGAPANRPLTPEDRQREVALAALLRKLSIDASFSRGEARTAGVVADSPASADELLDLALARGWVVQRGAELSVSPEGRQRTEELLRRAQL